MWGLSAFVYLCPHLSLHLFYHLMWINLWIHYFIFSPTSSSSKENNVLSSLKRNGLCVTEQFLKRSLINAMSFVCEGIQGLMFSYNHVPTLVSNLVLKIQVLSIRSTTLPTHLSVFPQCVSHQFISLSGFVWVWLPSPSDSPALVNTYHLATCQLLSTICFTCVSTQSISIQYNWLASEKKTKQPYRSRVINVMHCNVVPSVCLLLFDVSNKLR